MATRDQINVEELWELAKAGSRKLKPKERRRVLVYLEDIGEIRYSRAELSKIFRVSDATLRADENHILRVLGEQLTPEAQVLIVAGLVREYDQLYQTVKRAIAHSEPGTRGEREYIETALRILKEKRETYENVGVINKQLGSLNTSSEHWVATADVNTGELNVHPATPEETPPA